ncbi:MAG: MMPL family transporter [Planctomycetales bacterium]
MFRHLGEFVIHRWRVLFATWIVLSVLANGVLTGWINRLNVLPFRLPSWETIVQTGELQFLPAKSPSVESNALYNKAFPHDMAASNAVIVITRENGPLADNDADKAFITEVLRPEIDKVISEVEKTNGPTGVGKIEDFKDSQVGQLLMSKDKKSTLVMINLGTEFLDAKNQYLILGLEKLIEPRGRLAGKIPAGLTLSLSGSATVGRDMFIAQKESARNTEWWTVVLVVGLLLLIYRAPLLALIPLISVFIAVQVSICLIVLLARYAPWIVEPFAGLQTYITVVTYGAGVDYCLFLIARYKEELDRGVNVSEALTMTLDKIGAALAASAATVSVGIGMMYFAQFGKFQQAGICMALSLIIMLIAALTFTPPLLVLVGQAAFWPYGRSKNLSKSAGWISGASLFSRLLSNLQLHRMWEWTSDQILKTPMRIWLTFILLMLPFGIVGVMFHDYLSYGLLSELPRTKPSVIGAKAVQAHFTAGDTGPITVMLQNPDLDFDSIEGRHALEVLTLKLKDRADKLRVADVRSISHPVGLHHELPKGFARASFLNAARMHYNSRVEDKNVQHVTRMDVILKDDPFSRNSVNLMSQVQHEIEGLLSKDNPDNQKEPTGEEGDTSLKDLVGSSVHLVGTTASIRDLKKVTDMDQLVIDGLVLTTVYIILVILLREPAICAYLLVSVFFSYFVSLGATFVAFWAVDPSGFAGLDWKVPTFLFTILIAVGEDYNIFLMARIAEEQKEFGPVQGIKVAMVQTGSIISSCGIIMAGTFFSLVIAGTLAGMQQLGFALTVGVLLDTFIVRPILVPAYLILLNSGRFGRIGKTLGAITPEKQKALQTSSTAAS